MIDLDVLIKDTQALVRIDSRDAGAGEQSIVNWVTERIPAGRLVVEYFEALPGRQNVSVTLPGKSREGRLHLLAHMDTVPLSGHWSIDPFAGELRDGCIWGLGSADMKSGLAIGLNVLMDLAADLTFTPETDLVLWLTVNEESGMAGAQDLWRRGLFSSDDSAIALEPTGLRLRSAQVGVRWVRVQIDGRSAHAGRSHLGADANLALSRTIVAIRDRIDALEFHDPVLGKVLYNPGMIRAGEAANVVSGRAIGEFDFRLVPPMTDAGIIELVEECVASSCATVEGTEFSVEPLGPPRPPNRASDDSQVILALNSTFANVTGRALETGGADGHEAYTDASMLAALSGSLGCTVFGPGSSDFAHVPDERVPVADLMVVFDVINAVCRGWLRREGSAGS